MAFSFSRAFRDLDTLADPHNLTGAIGAVPGRVCSAQDLRSADSLPALASLTPL